MLRYFKYFLTIYALTALPGTLAYADSATQVAAVVNALLQKARQEFEEGNNEQAAATLERGLRVDPRNPVLWHNLAGVRLEQENWERAVSLAAKSNSLTIGTEGIDAHWLQIRNWTVIQLACSGMADKTCAQEAKRRAYVLATQ
jgi:tetratricopeptide (TPR) repeat protein